MRAQRKLVTQELAEACFCAAMTDKDGRDRHFQSELTNGLSDRVVIGELIGKDLKAADTPERLRACLRWLRPCTGGRGQA